jgi:hypothetical protein
MPEVKPVIITVLPDMSVLGAAMEISPVNLRWPMDEVYPRGVPARRRYRRAGE